MISASPSKRTELQFGGNRWLPASLPRDQGEQPRSKACTRAPRTARTVARTAARENLRATEARAAAHAVALVTARAMRPGGGDEGSAGYVPCVRRRAHRLCSIDEMCCSRNYRPPRPIPTADKDAPRIPIRAPHDAVTQNMT
eukprot:3502627-Prymnesium_polylepis.1